MLTTLASDMPYKPDNLEQAQYGLGVLAVLLIAALCFGGGSKAKAKAKPARAKASNGTGVILLIIAIALFSKSYSSDSSTTPEQPHNVTTPSQRP